MNHFISQLVSVRSLRCFLPALAAAATLVAPPAALAVEAANLPQSRVRSDAPLLEVAVKAVEAEASQADDAIVALRAAGPVGFAAFRQVHAAAISQLVETPACLCALGSVEQRVAQALDRIAAQRDAASSGLYWYTDFAAAQRAAEREGKPILTLRMLGKLTDDLSCANSRFFRTTLYADRETADYLSRTFILHWQSVRPVPQITIDFGDGRKMSRTITGNSAHYVVDASGRVIDGIPGLYGPKQFRAALQDAAEVAATLAKVDSEPAKQAVLVEYHAARERKAAAVVAAAVSPRRVSKNSFAESKSTRRGTLSGLNVYWNNAFSLFVGDALASATQTTVRMPRGQFPSAAQATRITGSKMVIETPMLAALGQIVEADVRMWIPTTRNASGLDLLTTTDTQSFGPAENSTVDLLGPEWRSTLENDVVAADSAPTSLTGVSLTPSIGKQIRDFNREGSASQSYSAAMTQPLLDTMNAPSRTAELPTEDRSQTPGGSYLAQLGISGEAMLDLATAIPTAEVWAQLAANMRSETEFDPRRLSLMRAKLLSIPAGAIPGEATDSAASFKDAREATITRTLARLADDVALDTARNEYDFHRRIHARLADGRRVETDVLNEWVYTSLFLTPNADPWLGLAPDDVFSALDAGGLSLGNEARAKTLPQTDAKVSSRAVAK